MATKYPTTERVTAGKLAEGDLLLVRARQSDGILLPGARWDRDLSAWLGEDGKVGTAFLPAGLHRVLQVRSALYQSTGRRARRIYQVVVRASDDSTVQAFDLDQTVRVNRVVSQ